MVRLALYKHKKLSLFDLLVRLYTRSSYTHCELVVADMSLSSSRVDKGVRAKVINFKPDHWDFLDVPWVTETEVLDFFEPLMGEPYGWLDLFANLLFKIRLNTRGHFCSGICAEALGFANPLSFTPASLAKRVKELTNVA